MDALEHESIERARRTSPGERALQALEAMRAGFRLKRAALRTRHPEESDAQIDARFRLWLERDGRG